VLQRRWVAPVREWEDKDDPLDMEKETKSTFLEELRWRGFLEATTSDDLDSYLAEAESGTKPGRTMYVGFDPTADSLHLGNLIPVMALAHAYRHGHRPLVLVGGGTGLIGDPSGKTSERTLLTKEKAESNAAQIRTQLSRFFDLPESHMLNNADWLLGLNLLDFLRDIGKHFSVNEMIKRDSVRTRLEERDYGISYTEFSYMLMQAYDFLYLFQHHGCTIQMGGSDQWGNILSGKELIRRVLGERAEGITFPLLTTSTGKKFGKSEEGSVWLDAKRTSPYQMYQYWLQTADADVIRYLKLFTFLGAGEIAELAAKVEAEPEKREAQRRLAYLCTEMIHGEKAASAEAVSRILFGSDEIPTGWTIHMLADEVPVTHVTRNELEGGIGLVDLLTRTRLAESKGAARKLIEGGGVYLYNERQAGTQTSVSMDSLRWPGSIMLRTGKKNYHLILVD
jgi:tyrosyl-tRNA synthetase